MDYLEIHQMGFHLLALLNHQIVYLVRIQTLAPIPLHRSQQEYLETRRMYFLLVVVLSSQIALNQQMVYLVQIQTQALASDALAQL